MATHASKFYKKPAPYYPKYQSRDKRIEEMYYEKQRRIDERINIKDKSIAYFNSLNAAINYCVGNKITEKEIILEWRDFFYTEWAKWYGEVTAPLDQKKIGTNNVVNETDNTVTQISF